tara:strand:+ start:2700 stop:3530 length:831 start_codon:yes stop_codon:yes gene_type:complete
MSEKFPRLSSPRLWSGLTLAGAALGVGLAGSADAEAYKLIMPGQSGVWLAQAEGGEGGEAGAIADVDEDTAYLVQLEIVEGHLVAALALYDLGMTDEAISLSYDPEAEMMDEVRAALAAHGAADITPLMTDFSDAMEKKAGAEAVSAALTSFRTAVATAVRAANPGLKTRFAIVTALSKAAADEISGAIENGVVTDDMAYNEAQAFLRIALRDAENIQRDLATADKAAADRAGRIAGLIAQEPLPFARTETGFVAFDPAIILSLAARVELIASQVR